MGILGTAHRLVGGMGAKRVPPLKIVTHTLQ